MNKSFVKNVIAVILGIALLIAVYEVFSMLIGAFVVDDALKFSTDGSMNKVIEFTTLEEKQKYEIFAVFKTVVYSKNTFKYYNFVNFSSEDEFNIFINRCKELSFYETNINPQYQDKFITLSTCEYSNKNGRLVVIARKINN